MVTSKPTFSFARTALRWGLAGLFVTSLWLGLGACAGKMPGTELGTFKVTSTITANTCGNGTGAPDPWDFSIQISKDTSTLYWSWLDGTPPVSGTLTSTTEATITGVEADNLGGPDAGPTACTMARNDNLSVVLGTGATPTTFTGTLVYNFTVTSGNCAGQMTASGGIYDALPCTITYTLAGTK